MGAIGEFIMSPLGAAIVRGCILAGVVGIVLGVFFLDRYLRTQFKLIVENLTFISQRMRPEIRQREFRDAIRAVLESPGFKEPDTDEEG